jgi:uncharacterized protein (DUF952 family)
MEICHVVQEMDWELAASEEHYASPSLERDGFLHCCTREQLPFVLAKHFPDATGLLVVTFETDEVEDEVLWVESEPGMKPFPHLHGPLPRAAVRSVLPV